MASKLAASKAIAVLSVRIVLPLELVLGVLRVRPVGVCGTGIVAEVGVTVVEEDCWDREY